MRCPVLPVLWENLCGSPSTSWHHPSPGAQVALHGHSHRGLHLYHSGDPGLLSGTPLCCTCIHLYCCSPHLFPWPQQCYSCLVLKKKVSFSESPLMASKCTVIWFFYIKDTFWIHFWCYLTSTILELGLKKDHLEKDFVFWTRSWERHTPLRLPALLLFHLLAQPSTRSTCGRSRSLSVRVGPLSLLVFHRSTALAQARRNGGSVQLLPPLPVLDRFSNKSSLSIWANLVGAYLHITGSLYNFLKKFVNSLSPRSTLYELSFLSGSEIVVFFVSHFHIPLLGVWDRCVCHFLIMLPCCCQHWSLFEVLLAYILFFLVLYQCLIHLPLFLYLSLPVPHLY